MIAWAARRPAVVWSASAALLLAGAVAFARLPLATRPAVELPRLSITAEWPGIAAELVEAYLTAPIEGAVQGVAGVERIASESLDGRAELTVDLAEGADVRLTRLAVLERLELLRPELPAGAEAPVVANYVPEELDEEPLLRYTIAGPYTAGTLSQLSREEIEPRVSAIPGVAGVATSGQTVRGVSVSYDPGRLRQLGIGPAALDGALRGARLIRALGTDRRGAVERQVSLRDQPAAVEDLAALPVVGPAGRIFRLGELATIRLEEDARDRFFRLDGESAVSVVVSRQPGADAIRTATAVRQALAALESRLPPGIRLRVQSDESTRLAAALRELLIRGAVAFLAVTLVLVVALRNAKSVLLVLGSAAVAIAGTALGLYLLGIPANLLTLAGLGMGIGILVQNGLVVVERLRLAPDTPEGRAEAGRRITPAVLGATLTTAVVLFPFLYLQGNARAAFVPFALAFALALGWSVVASLVMIPALGAGHGIARDPWPRALRVYGRIVAAILRRRHAVLGATVAVLGLLGWAFATKVPRSSLSFWLGQRTVLMARLSFPRGSDPSALDRGMREFERLVVGVPGVEQVVAQGGAEEAFMSVVFTDEAGSTALPYELQDLLTERAVLIGGAQVSVTGRGPGFSSGGAVGVAQYRIKVLGYSYAGVEALALDLKRRLELMPRVRNVDANAGSFWRRDRAYTVALEPDRGALARAGLSAAEFARAVAREVRGVAGGYTIEVGGEEIRVSLKAAGARDRTLDQLRAALVPTSTAAPVKVSDLARVGEREALAAINREDQQYLRIVSYDFRGPAKLAERTHRAFMRSIAVPPGYSVDDDDFFWAQDDSGRGLWLVFAVGVALVVLAAAAVFDSLWATGMVFLGLPLALAGVAAAFWFAGAAFSREAAVGVILVVGLAVNQGILLVDGALDRIRRGAGPVAAAYRAALDRAGMIALVTLTALASLLPLAVGTDSDQLFGAIALATVGGTVAGTLGALLVLPALLVARRGQPR
ncbi:MAG TPA: efflux RND transporter permease subunit [Gemmatimonadales bacterium]|nr:efflux RND transporter permease subunit [Gemmatimonadales bacterium]